MPVTRNNPISKANPTLSFVDIAFCNAGKMNLVHKGLLRKEGIEQKPSA